MSSFVSAGEFHLTTDRLALRRFSEGDVGWFVELYADPETSSEPFVQEMRAIEPAGGAANAFVYRATVETTRPARHFTPRIVPFHPEARLPIELPLILWAA